MLKRPTLLPTICLILAASACDSGEPDRAVKPGAGRSALEVPAPKAPFVGSAVCAECHPAITEAFSKTPMAQAARWVTPDNIGQFVPEAWRERPFKDPFTGATYELESEGDHVFLVGRGPSGETSREPIDLAFGAGLIAHTFVTPKEARLLEHRVTWFVEPKALGITPTHPNIDDLPGRLHTATTARLCLGCHGTGLEVALDGTLDLSGYVPSLGCERCHGPGEEHVASAVAGDPTRMRAWNDATGPEEIERCGECHRTIETVDFSEILGESSRIVRHAAVGTALAKCARSDERFGCTLCHDPHSPLVHDPAYYTERCLGCHDGLEGEGHAPSCGAGEEARCSTCHMPKVEVPEMGFDGASYPFADHWIRLDRGDLPRSPVEFREKAERWSELVDALVERYEEHSRKDERDLLNWNNLGLAHQARQEWEKAELAFRKATVLSPRFAQAWGNLGALYEETGRPEDAIAAYRQVVAIDPSDRMTAARLRRLLSK
ncbi:MAG: tetratricopeptide repeat protein [Planctomycetota bacterium]